jgi:HEAT repeats
MEVPDLAKSARRLLENVVRMSLTYFCPSCWHEVGAVGLCPKCGADLRTFSGKSYEEKLILALSHPEPTVPVRAAAILAELGSLVSVESLINLASAATDPYIQEAAVEALGRMGDSRALTCLGRLSREGAVRVRAAAELAVRSIQERPRANNG